MPVESLSKEYMLRIPFRTTLTTVKTSHKEILASIKPLRTLREHQQGTDEYLLQFPDELFLENPDKPPIGWYHGLP